MTDNFQTALTPEINSNYDFPKKKTFFHESAYRMGRKQEGNGIRAKIHSAGVQIKVLDQKGVIGMLE